jgi:hypothetical protein
MMKVIVALCNFVNAPKNQQLSVNKIGKEPVVGRQDIMGSSSRNNQHYALICTNPLLYILAATCFGSSLP